MKAKLGKELWAFRDADQPLLGCSGTRLQVANEQASEPPAAVVLVYDQTTKFGVCCADVDEGAGSDRFIVDAED